MTNHECEALRERMPEVAGSGTDWTAQELQHLTACADCAAEWRLVQVSRRLGEAAVARLDPARIAGAVQASLVADRRRVRFARAAWLTGLAAAAAVVLLLWYRPVSPGTQVASSTVGTFTLPLAELEGLDADQLGEVLDGLDQPLDDGAAGEAPRLGELDDQQLERVLRSLEG